MDPVAFTNLIRLSFNRDADPMQRDLAGRTLREYLVNLAKRVAYGDCFLLDELIGHVLVQCGRGMYEPRQNSTPDAWVLTIMRNYRVSVGQRPLRAQGGEALLAEVPERRDDQISRDLRADLTTPFCPEDAARVQVWTLRQRIIILPWYLLWRKLDHHDWRRTVRASCVRTPFPERDFDRLDETDRTASLAKALDLTANAITQALGRGHEKVLALRFTRELGDMA